MPTIVTYIVRTKGIEKISRSRLREILSTRYDIALGYGFSNFNKIDRNLFASSLVYSNIQRERVFDPEENNFVYQNRLAFSEVSFEIDLEKSIMLVKGGATKIKRLINVLGTLLDNKIAFDYVHLSLQQTLRSLRNNSDGFTLHGIIIQNYSPEPDISGKFSAKVNGSLAAERILSDYTGEIIEFTGIIVADGLEAKLRVSDSGIVAINSSEEGIRRTLDIIKEISQESLDA